MTNVRYYPKFLDEWRIGEDDELNPLGYLQSEGALNYVVVAQWLYVPDFVEYRGGVFFADIPGGLSSRRKQGLDGSFVISEGNLPRIESPGNLVELWDYFDGESVGSQCEDIVQVARSVRDSWDALLRVRFPERSFNVYCRDGDTDSSPAVSFYAKPDESVLP